MYSDTQGVAASGDHSEKGYNQKAIIVQIRTGEYKMAQRQDCTVLVADEKSMTKPAFVAQAEPGDMVFRYGDWTQ
jgi:hypothetical protein